MTPKSKRKADPGADVVLARTLVEQEWAHGRWLQHESWTQMRVTAGRPPSDGGLGYDLSIQALKGLVDGYRQRVGDLTATREQHIERELNDLDLAQQLALRSMAKGAEAGALDVHGTKLFVDIGRERRKLLGLDAATKIEADVVHRDAVTEELNAMLVRAGRPPIEVAE